MTDHSIAASKAALRIAALSRRNGLSSEARGVFSHRIAENVMPFLTGNGFRSVSAYWPIRSETDPLPILEMLAERGIVLALPRLKAGAITFRAWRPGEPLETGEFGLSEPPAASPIIFPDIVLAPLVAFDQSGGRIGYGKGYYDAALTTLCQERPVIAIGLAFSVQETGQVPMEAHDRRLDGVATENGLALFQ